MKLGFWKGIRVGGGTRMGMFDGGQTLEQRIAAWQTTDLVHVGGIAQSDFTGTGGGGAAADFTLLMPAYGIFQNSTIQSVTVNAVAVDGSNWKLKIFRWNGSTYAFLRESTFVPGGTGVRTVALATPLACAPGDILAVYCPPLNQIYWRPSSRSLNSRFAAGDITADNVFTSNSANDAIEMDALGYKPYLALVGNSILDGSGNGTQKWYGLYDTSIPAYILSTPGGEPTSEVGSIIRSLVSDGTLLQYQNLGLGSTDWAQTAGTGAGLCVVIKPYATVVHNGTNDIQSLTWEQVEGYLDTTLSVLQAGGSKMMLTEILPRTAYTDEQAALIRTWNANYATWCTTNGVTLIACHDAMGQVRVSTGEIDDLLAAYNQDNIHLTAAGVAAWAAIIAAAL